MVMRVGAGAFTSCVSPRVMESVGALPLSWGAADASSYWMNLAVTDDVTAATSRGQRRSVRSNFVRLRVQRGQAHIHLETESGASLRIDVERYAP